jgi:hypothetical protein
MTINETHLVAAARSARQWDPKKSSCVREWAQEGSSGTIY